MSSTQTRMVATSATPEAVRPIAITLEDAPAVLLPGQGQLYACLPAGNLRSWDRNLLFPVGRRLAVPGVGREGRPDCSPAGTLVRGGTENPQIICGFRASAGIEPSAAPEFPFVEHGRQAVVFSPAVAIHECSRCLIWTNSSAMA